MSPVSLASLVPIVPELILALGAPKSAALVK